MSGWLWGLVGVLLFVALGLLLVVALGIWNLPGDLGRRLRLRAREPDVHRGVELPDEVPRRDSDEP